jgi:REP-associated tyrosine transposase
MNERLLIAYHLIWTGYGRWLPNDPRGSSSTVAVERHVAALGQVHFGRKKVQPPGRVVREFYERAKAALKYPLLDFGPREIAVIGEAFAELVERQRYTCYSCAIMPDHVHILIRKHRDWGEDMTEHLQIASRDRLAELRTFDPDHPVWTNGEWKRYVFEPDDLRGVISYIESNPLKLGWRRQEWAFVKEYDGWPLHPGHNPISPWARGLRKK